MAMRMAIMLMTTRSSISEKALREELGGRRQEVEE
jgi:hypothetical protein